MSEVWENYPLQSLVIKVGSGSTPKGGSEAYKAVGTPLIRSMNVIFFGFKRAGLAYIDANQAALLDNAIVKAGDVLLNITGASIGRVTLAPGEFDGARVNQHVCIIRPNEALDARFLNAYLSSPSLQSQIWNDNFGVTRQALTKQQILDFEVPVPPKAEQTRIVNQLDTLLARVQACNDRFDAMPALLKRFRQTVLDAALNGACLDGAAVAEPELPKVSISTIASVGTGSTPLRTNSQFFASSGTPWITSSATSAAVVISANEFVTPAAISTHRLKLFPKGTLLVAMYGEGKTRGQVAELGIEATINQACAAVVVNESKAVRAYVKLALQANYLNMRELAEGGNQPNLNLSKVKEFEIPLPSLADQTEIVRRVEALFALADRIEARCTTARAQAQRLTPLVLSKAFRGELVPQDPSDEPAGALLARIAVQRAAPAERSQSKKPRQARTPHALKEATAMTKSRQDEDVKDKPYLADHLLRLATATTAEELFKASELPVADFYKQLAWEVAQGHISDGGTTLEARHAVG